MSDLTKLAGRGWNCKVYWADACKQWVAEAEMFVGPKRIQAYCNSGRTKGEAVEKLLAMIPTEF